MYCNTELLCSSTTKVGVIALRRHFDDPKIARLLHDQVSVPAVLITVLISDYLDNDGATRRIRQRYTYHMYMQYLFVDKNYTDDDRRIVA